MRWTEWPVANCASSRASPKARSPRHTTGQRPPQIAGTTLDGRPRSLADYQGDVVLLNFWASWCAPCRVETPELQELYASQRSAGLQVIGVTVKDDRHNAEAFQRNKGVQYPSLWDPSSRVALAFRNLPTTLPSTVLIDRHGRVAAAYTGAVEKDGITPAIRKLLAES